MEIIDFLPKYPNIEDTKYPNLNPYENKNFNDVLYHKKEFYENRLEEDEKFPSEKGMLTKYQNTIVRFLSSNTPYNRLLLVHDPGLGKTCSAIGSIERIKNENSNFKGALILAKGDTILDNFKEQLVQKCTRGQYIPENFQKLSQREKVFRIKKLISYYNFNTFQIFAKELEKINDTILKERYSNLIIVIDEVHNLRIQDKSQEDEKQPIEVYKQFHRFIHTVENCKILLMSGTPLKDSIEELSSIGNLLVSKDQQFPEGEQFLKEYTTLENNIYKIKDAKIPEIKKKLKGKVSVLKERPSKVQKKFLGKRLKHLDVDILEMSQHQLEGYIDAFNKDIETKSLLENSREASLFVFPDGSYGNTGFKKYISEIEEKKIPSKRSKIALQKRYKFNNNFDIKNTDTDEVKLEKIKKYSCKYASVIEKILNKKGNCFLYSSIVEGSGCILLSLLLELFGYSRANGTETEVGKRYALLTGSTTNKKTIVERFNKLDNVEGEIIQIIVGSRAVSEGLSFNNIIFEGILTPHWNYSETSQAIARGIRLGSHNELIKLGKTPKVEIQQSVATSKNFKEKEYSIDLHMYKISEDKDVSIKSVLRILMEISFDCALNYKRNRIFGKDGSRECEYQNCEYSCDGIDMKNMDIDPENIDYSSYNVLYSTNEHSDIKKKVEELFRKDTILTKDMLLQYLEKYKNQELDNIIYILNQKNSEKNLPKDTFHYNRFLEAFSNYPVKKIMNSLENMFRNNFLVSFGKLKSEFSDYTNFEVITALRTIIDENIPLKNRYGFTNYLREEGNNYFLVGDVNIESQSYNEYYTKNINIVNLDTYEDIIVRSISKNIINIVEKIFEKENEDILNKLCSYLPNQLQEILLENSIDADEKNIEKMRI